MSKKDFSMDTDDESYSQDSFPTSSQDSFPSSQSYSQDTRPVEDIESYWYGSTIPMTKTSKQPGTRIYKGHTLPKKAHLTVNDDNSLDEFIIYSHDNNLSGKARLNMINCYIDYKILGENILIEIFECGEGYGKILFEILLDYLLKTFPYLKTVSLHAMPWIDINKYKDWKSFYPMSKFEDYVYENQIDLNNYYETKLHLERMDEENHFQGNIRTVLQNIENDKMQNIKKEQSIGLTGHSLSIPESSDLMEDGIYEIIPSKNGTDYEEHEKQRFINYIRIRTQESNPQFTFNNYTDVYKDMAEITDINGIIHTIPAYWLTPSSNKDFDDYGGSNKQRKQMKRRQTKKIKQTKRKLTKQKRYKKSIIKKHLKKKTKKKG